MRNLEHPEIEKAIEEIEKLDSIISSCIETLYERKEAKNVAYTLELVTDKLTQIKKTLDERYL